MTQLLAQARRIEARSNFTQNVVRAARQTPQDRGWLASLKAWWEDVSYAPAGGKWALAAGVTAAVALSFAVLQTQQDAAPQFAEQPVILPEVPLLPAAKPKLCWPSRTRPSSRTARSASCSTEPAP